MADGFIQISGPVIETDRRLHDLVTAAANCYPEHVAVWYDGSSVGLEKVKYSYRELMNMSKWVLEVIRQKQCCHQVIGLLCQDQPSLPVWIMGILSTPAAFLPLSSGIPASWIKNLVQILDIFVILADSRGLQHLQSEIPDLIESVENTKDLMRHLSVQLPEYLHLHLVKIKSDQSMKTEPMSDLAYVITTSGTTGQPKIVRVPHHCIVPNIIHISEIYKLRSCDLVYQASPLTFDPSIVEIFSTFHCGATLLVLPEDTRRHPQQLANILFDHGVTIMQATPTLISSIGPGHLSKTLLSPCSRLRVLALGGERCPSYATITSWRGSGNTTQVINLYGITEVSSWAMYHILTEEDSNREGIPLGQPLYNTTLCIDNQDNYDLSGLMSLGGSSRICYLDDEYPGNNVTMVMRPTGDLVKQDGEHLYYIGRTDEQIKRNGKRINPVEIENVCEKLHDIHKASVAYKHPHLYMFICVGGDTNEGTPTLSQPDLVCQALEQRVDAHLREQLPLYYIPDHIILVKQMPSTHHGKVDKVKLMTDYKKKQLKDKLCTLWKRHTCQSLDYVLSDTDRFLECGGDSLSAIRLVDTIETKVLGYSFHDNILLDNVLNYTLEDLCNELWFEINDNERGVKSKMKDNVMKRNIIDEKSVISNQTKAVHASSDNNVIQRYANPTPNDVHDDSDPHNVSNIDRKHYDSQNVMTSHRKRYDALIDHETEVIDHNATSVMPPCKKPRRDCQLPGVEDKHLSTDTPVSCDSEILSVSRVCQIQTHGQNGMVRLDPDRLDDICYTGLHITEEWTYNMGKCVDSSPLLVVNRRGGGRVYIGSHCKQCTLAALDLTTASLMWSAALYTRIEATPCLSMCGRFVIVGAYDHCVYVYKAESGVQYWAYRTEGQVKDMACVHPTNGRVYIGSHDQNIYCLDIEEKQCIWRVTLAGSVFASPCISINPDHLYVATTRGHVYSLEMESGSKLWDATLTSPVFSSPALTPGGICVATVGHVIYYFTHQGYQVWSHQCDGPIFSSPCIYRNHKKTRSKSANEHLAPISDMSRHINIPPDHEQHNSEPIGHRQHNSEHSGHRQHNAVIHLPEPFLCVVGDHSGAVTCLDSNGKLLWKQKMSSPVYSSPFVFSNHGDSALVVVCSTVGEVHVTLLETGRLVGEWSTRGGQIFSSPVVWDDKLVLGCRDNYVYCLKLHLKHLRV